MTASVSTDINVALKEWELARAAITHFDDLLMRIRTFGLPVLATVIGGGVAIGAEQPSLDVPWYVSLGVAIGIAVVFPVTLALIHLAEDKQQLPKGARVRPLENIGLLLGMVFALAWAGELIYERPSEYLLSAPVLVIGGMILFSIYLLDRFYYTTLLLGAVGRAKEIEKQKDMGLTIAIKHAAPNWTYTVLPAAFYFIPVLILINLGFAVFVFTD